MSPSGWRGPQRIAKGIEIDDTTWGQLSDIAQRYQIRIDS